MGYGLEVATSRVLVPIETPGSGIVDLRVVALGVVEGSDVTVDVLITAPDVMVVVRVVLMPGSIDVESAGAEVLDVMADTDIDDAEDKIPGGSGGVVVTEPLDRLGGITLLSHSVVPLTTE